MSQTDLIPSGGTAVAPAEQSEVSELVSLAIKEKVPVEVLERIVALQERVTDRHARTAFFEALAAFRNECPPILKTRENSQFKVTREGTSRSARYAPLEEIDRIARPIAAKHGLVWTWDTRIEGELMHVTCRVIHTMGHSEVTNVSMPYESKAGSSAQQKFGSTQTYGMRYSLVAALGITTADEDTDGAGPSPETIGPNAAADLDALADEVGINKARFLKWLGVEHFEDITMRDYERAKDELEKRR